MSLTDEQIQEDARACLESKVRQAQRMTPKERFFAGAELFEDACEITLAGIRARHPDWGKEELMEELRRIIKLDSRRK
ncbi:hypothetical protein N9A86_04690 [Akkermansiaceae bacterium]|nr:hypothetical protein [Akkermansiaceae bacterium]